VVKRLNKNMHGDDRGWYRIPEDRELAARSFVAAAGLQCGFCIPGIALRALHLLDKDPEPTRAAIARALDVHLCRCTGYTKILDAVELMARGRRGEALPEPEVDGRVDLVWTDTDKVFEPEDVYGDAPNPTIL